MADQRYAMLEIWLIMLYFLRLDKLEKPRHAVLNEP